MTQSTWPAPSVPASAVSASAVPVPAVSEEAVRIRSLGTGLVIASFVMLVGGMALEQGFVMLAGLLTFCIALLFRRVETKRALAALPTAQAQAVADEVGRTAVRASILRSILLTVLAQVLIGVTIWLGVQ